MNNRSKIREELEYRGWVREMTEEFDTYSRPDKEFKLFVAGNGTVRSGENISDSSSQEGLRFTLLRAWEARHHG